MEHRSTPGDTEWFKRDRFGMFIHWGLYALPARHEWVKQYEQLSDEHYERYFRHFDPDLYDPRLWAKAAQNAGMKYAVVTSKHHEGFCLWDSAWTEFKATRTPARRDLLKPLVDAFGEQGLRTGFYYSLIDWHHPDFLIDDNHPQRSHPEREALNAGRDPSRYAEYLRNQVQELLTQFGDLDILWCDFSYPSRPGWVGKGHEDWESEKLYALIRKLRPKIILNDRLDLAEGWDIKTPEQFQPRKWVTFGGQRVTWEACQTFSGSWGYHRDESSWKSEEQLVQMLIDTVSKGGNLLLNVGPTGRGEFDARALERLEAMGEWMRRHSRSIYGCTEAPAEWKTPQDCRLTYNPKTNRMYVHLFAYPFQHLHLDGFAGKVEYAQLLNDASEVPMKGLEPWQLNITGASETELLDFGQTLTLTLPIQKPKVLVPVIELFLK